MSQINQYVRRYYKGQDVFNLPLYDKETYEQISPDHTIRKLIYFKNDKGQIFGALAWYKDGDKVKIDLNNDTADIPIGWIIKFKDWCGVRIKCSKCGLSKHPDEFNMRRNKSGLLKFTSVCAACNNKKRNEKSK